jgi:cytoskeleton protein RodZ
MSKLLKKQREYLGTQVKEIASATNIKESWVLAIEDEDYDKLPNEGDTRGYIMEYAKYLGLPVESIMAPYEKYLEMKRGAKGNKMDYLADAMEKAYQRSQDNALRQVDREDALGKEVRTQTESPTIERVDEKGGAKRSRFIWIGSLLLVAVLTIFYQFILSKPGENKILTAPVPSQQSAQKEQAVKPEASIVSTNESRATEKTISAHKQHLLEMSAADKTWIQVVIDGIKTEEALLKPGERITYKANNTFSIVVGNAGGCTVKFDGTALPGGRKGQVVRLTLP